MSDVKSMGIVMADQAGATGKASGGIIEELFIRALCFGVVTPGASKRTALQKDGGAKSRTVMHTEPLNIGDSHRESPFDCEMIISCHSLLRVTNRAFHPETRTERV
jgi:hypothetical protein